jgi:hypothetical protein
MTEQQRRTKRRYAHELYPHAEQDQPRPLAVEVPYLYSRAIGFQIWGTEWFNVEPRALAGERTMHLIDARWIALLADALLQDMVGDEAWSWAARMASDETGELVGERAEFYGVPWDQIKPYPCGPEPDHHDHFDAADSRGWRTSHRIVGKESECEECTEPVVDAPEATADAPEMKRLNVEVTVYTDDLLDVLAWHEGPRRGWDEWKFQPDNARKLNAYRNAIIRGADVEQVFDSMTSSLQWAVHEVENRGPDPLRAALDSVGIRCRPLTDTPPSDLPGGAR